MPLRAKILDPNFANMAQTTEKKPQTGIKVIIVGAGTIILESELKASLANYMV